MSSSSDEEVSYTTETPDNYLVTFHAARCSGRKLIGCPPAVALPVSSPDSSFIAQSKTSLLSAASTPGVNRGSDSCSEQLLHDAMSDQKLFLKQWHYSQRQQLLKDKPVRFPHFKRLLDAHYGVPENAQACKIGDIRQIGGLRRGATGKRPLGKSQFGGGGNVIRRKTMPAASYLEHQPEFETRL